MNTDKAQIFISYIIGALIAFLFFLILKPFLLPLFWAAVFAIILNPINQWLINKSKSRSIGAMLTLILGAAVLIVPLAVLLGATVNSLEAIYRGIGGVLVSFNAEIAKVQTTFAKLPFFWGEEIFGASMSERLYSSIAELMDYLMRVLSDIGENILLFSVKLLVMLYTLYFFLRDGEIILKKTRSLFPTGSKMEIILLERFPKAATAVLKTTVVMVSLQGILGGVIFYLAGLDNAPIWGFLMALATLVPSLGCAIIWLPTAIVMFLLGDIKAGMVIVLGGVLIITPIDYFLRPLIIGKDIGVHPLLIFLSSLGGIMLIGLSGLILGPIIAALAVSVLETFIDRETA